MEFCHQTSSKTIARIKRDKTYVANGVEQSVTPLWGTITVKLPERAGRQQNSGRMEINKTRIPHRNVQMFRPGLDVHCGRSRLDVAYCWHLVHGQHVRPGWQPGAIAVTLCDVPHRPAIDLKIERKIPSEVRYSIHGEAARRDVTRPEITGTSLRNSADENCAQKDQKNLAGEAVFGFHATQYT
jgi:hypothetical protein